MNAPHTVFGHETRDFSPGKVVVMLTGVAVMAAIAIAIVYGIFQYLAGHPATTAPANPLAETSQEQAPPPPRVEVRPYLELKDLHAYEDQFLGTYGWTDKAAGVVRIPIDKAMELQLEKGFPVRQEATKK